MFKELQIIQQEDLKGQKNEEINILSDMNYQMRDSQSLKSQYQFDNFLSVQTENQDSENMNGREVRQLETLFTQEDEQMLEKNILRQDQSNKIRAHNILTQKSSDQNSICLSQQNQLFDLELKNTQDSKIVDANSNNIRNSYASYNLSQLTEKIRNSIIKNRKIQQISPNFQPENKSKKNSLINFTGLDLNQKKSNQSNRKWNVAVNLSTALRVKQKLKSFLPQKFSKVSQYELTLIGDASYMNEKNNLIEINHNYVKDGFILDVISLIGYVLGIYSSYFFLFTFLRVNNIMKLMDDINNRFYLTEKYQKFWVLTKLFAMIILMNHFFACFFHYIGNYFQNDPSDTWIKTQGLDSCDWIQRYTEALYFSFITCITIGYGDITPKNDYERLTVIIFSCLSTVCFSYSVNTIGSILQDYQNKYQKYIQMRYNAIKFMGNRKINKELQMRALKYIEYIQTIEEDSPENGLSVVNQMSSQLKFQIFSDFYGKILSQHKYFALNYSKQTINKLSSRVQEKLFVPGEVIFEQGEQDMRLFYLIKGECEYYLQNKGGNKHSQIQSIAFTNEQNFFGYKGFISGIPREMSCRSTNITHVFYISRDDLISVLKEDPLDYEQFCKVRDQYQLYTSSLGEQCFTCKSYKHTMIQCPKIHFSKNRQLLMYKYNYSADQIRQYKKRKCLKYATILNMDLISFCAKKYRKNITTSLNRQRNDAPNNKFNENYQECLIPDKIYSLQYPYVIQQNHEISIYLIIKNKVKFQGQTFKDIKLYDNQDLDSDSFSDSDSSYSQSSLPSQQTINEDQYNEDLEENDDDQDDFNNQKQLFLQNSKKSSQDQENKQLQSNDDIDLFQENKIKRNNFMQRKLSYSPTKKKSSSPDRKKDSHQNSQQKQEEGEINMKKKLFTKQVESKNQGDIAKKINSQNKINSLEDLEKQQCNQQQNNSSNPTSFSQMCLSKKSSKQRNLNDQNKNQKQLQKHHIEFNIDNISIQNWFESKKSYKSQKSQKLFDRSDKPGSIESLQNENKLYKSMSHKMQEKCNIQKQQIRRQKAIKSMTLLLKQNSYKEQKQINNNINELHLELSKQKFNQILEKQNQFMQQIAKSIQQLQESQKNNILNLADHSASQHEQNSKDNEQMKLHRINVKNTQQIDSDLFFYEFDSVKEFKKYFPYNNASSVCQSLKPKVNQNQQINNQRYSFLSKRSIYQKKNSLLLKSKSEFYKQKQQQDKE